MKIAVIVPSWIVDIEKIPFLLDSIEQQSRKPDIVVLCISSIPSDMVIEFPGYSFPIQIKRTEIKQSSAQNRNTGIFFAKEEYDILSFIDSDDLMHPQRLEFLEKFFKETQYSAIVHGYIGDLFGTEINWNLYSLDIPIIPKFISDSKMAHYGHVSIRSLVAEDLLFPTDKATIGKEDTVFIENMESAGFTLGFLEIPLSFYTQCSKEERIEKDLHLHSMRGGVY